MQILVDKEVEGSILGNNKLLFWEERTNVTFLNGKNGVLMTL